MHLSAAASRVSARAARLARWLRPPRCFIGAGAPSISRTRVRPLPCCCALPSSAAPRPASAAPRCAAEQPTPAPPLLLRRSRCATTMAVRSPTATPSSCLRAAPLGGGAAGCSSCGAPRLGRPCAVLRRRHAAPPAIRGARRRRPRAARGHRVLRVFVARARRALGLAPERVGQLRHRRERVVQPHCTCRAGGLARAAGGDQRVPHAAQLRVLHLGFT